MILLNNKKSKILRAGCATIGLVGAAGVGIVFGSVNIRNMSSLRSRDIDKSNNLLIDHTIQEIKQILISYNILLTDTEKEKEENLSSNICIDMDITYLKNLILRQQKVLEDLEWVKHHKHTKNLKNYFELIRNISESPFSEGELMDDYIYHLTFELNLDDRMLKDKTIIHEEIQEIFKDILIDFIEFIYILEYNNNCITIHVIIVTVITRDTTRDTLLSKSKILLLKLKNSITNKKLINVVEVLINKKDYLLPFVSCFKDEKKLLQYCNNIFFYQKK